MEPLLPIHMSASTLPTSRRGVIGVIGGMGPRAGLDLVGKIIDHTTASSDQHHLPVALLSYPGDIIDRNAFLLRRVRENPAQALATIAYQLVGLGSTVIGMACNSAHAPPIFDEIKEQLLAKGCTIKLVDMISESAAFVRDEHSGARCVGLLSTLAVRRLGLYERALNAMGIETVAPDEEIQSGVVEPLIYDPDFGVKAKSTPVTPKAHQRLIQSVIHLRDKGADVVLLGCTELPLALQGREVEGVAFVDPTAVLARSLIRETYPDRLRPLPSKGGLAVDAAGSWAQPSSLCNAVDLPRLRPQLN